MGRKWQFSQTSSYELGQSQMLPSQKRKRDEVKQPKNKGGMGIRDLAYHNKS